MSFSRLILIAVMLMVSETSMAEPIAKVFIPGSDLGQENSFKVMTLCIKLAEKSPDVLISGADDDVLKQVLDVLFQSEFQGDIAIERSKPGMVPSIAFVSNAGERQLQELANRVNSLEASASPRALPLWLLAVVLIWSSLNTFLYFRNKPEIPVIEKRQEAELHDEYFCDKPETPVIRRDQEAELHDETVPVVSGPIETAAETFVEAVGQDEESAEPPRLKIKPKSKLVKEKEVAVGEREFFDDPESEAPRFLVRYRYVRNSEEEIYLSPFVNFLTDERLSFPSLTELERSLKQCLTDSLFEKQREELIAKEIIKRIGGSHET